MNHCCTVVNETAKVGNFDDNCRASQRKIFFGRSYLLVQFRILNKISLFGMIYSLMELIVNISGKTE